MRIIVCGGRDYHERDSLFATLDSMLPNVEELGSGGANGADAMAIMWAKSREIPYQVFPPDWVKYGKAAGPMRNQRMLDEFKPDKVIAFPGGKGTKDMMSRTAKAGVPVQEIK